MMRRWNGWGDERTLYPLPESAGRHLAGLVGEGQPSTDASIEQALALVPDSSLAPHPLVQTGPEERLLHARGQSLPDWVALRSGRIGVFPDGVAHPTSDEDVRSLLDYAGKTEARLIPYGGGTSVVGHINPLHGDRPTLTVDLSRLDEMESLDETSRLATFEAGVRGPALEENLNRRGYTLGHFPQSFELSTLGGWIATRSSGQQSYRYGRIENLFAGGHVETPAGPLDLPPLPASAAGPDLRHFLLGSEGRLGMITRAVVRIRRLPESEAFHGIFFRNWESGVEAVRQVAQEGVPISMARLSDADETESTLALSGKDGLVAWANRGLGMLGYGPRPCLLILGVTGTPSSTGQAYRRAAAIFRRHGGLPTGVSIGRLWQKSRFLTPYLRNTLWERGYAIDTLETALPWAGVLEAATAIKSALLDSLAACGERILVFAHLSHIYPDGASIYVTYLFRRCPDPDETLQRWGAMKSAASQAILSHGGTISHQHGVGTDHAAYLAAEKGTAGMAALQAVQKTFDPQGLMNPGKLLVEG